MLRVAGVGSDDGQRASQSVLLPGLGKIPRNLRSRILSDLVDLFASTQHRDTRLELQHPRLWCCCQWQRHASRAANFLQVASHLESVTNVRWLVSPKKSRNTTVLFAGRPSCVFVATCMYLLCRARALALSDFCKASFQCDADMVETQFAATKVDKRMSGSYGSFTTACPKDLVDKSCVMTSTRAS